MIKTRRELKEWLKYEKNKYFGNKNILLMYITNASEKIIIWKFQKKLRKYEYHLNCLHKFRALFLKFKLNKLRNKYGLSIPANTMGKGLKIMHLGSISINDNVRVGENCSIHINTALAARGNSDECPIIGNNAIIGIGAIIIGNVVLGDNIVIGAGAVVNKSFPENSVTIAGVPAKIISNNGSETWKR